MIRQRTLKNPIKATGVGVHTGKKIYLTLRPAPVDSGIVFRRTDLDEVVEIPGTVENVGDTRMSTTLANGQVRVSTVEHLMSALAGLGIDNAYIDVSASEIPIMDGSAAPFVFLLQSAGVEEQPALKRFIRIKETVRIEEGDKWAELHPYDGFRISFTLDFDHPVFEHNAQSASVNLTALTFSKEISRARTFGFVSDYEKLREQDLARGASLDNTIVLDEYRTLNEDGLRYPDEFVKHKILDAVGDMYLLGSPVIGHFKGFKAGHTLNNLLLRKLLANQQAWEYVTFDDKEASSLAKNWSDSFGLALDPA